MSVSDTWKDLYRTILNANVIIDRVTDNEDVGDADVRTDIIADARFIRGLCYWHITNLWGDAPYYTEVLTLEEISSLGRAPEATIIEGVLEDLQFAQDNLQTAYTGDQSGRASKWAAAIVIAKIYMKQQQWQQGLDKCLEIINQSPHRLLDTYNEVFDQFNDSKEKNLFNVRFCFCKIIN